MGARQGRGRGAGCDREHVQPSRSYSWGSSSLLSKGVSQRKLEHDERLKRERELSCPTVGNIDDLENSTVNNIRN